MLQTWVLKLAQVDLPNQPILVHITKKEGHEIDLDLLATDGDTAYRGKLRARNYTKSKSSNYDGTDEQWLAILKYVLVSTQTSEIDEDEKKGIQVECAISTKGSKTQLSIAIHSRIEDITHRLGTVELMLSEDVSDVDLFGWTCQVIDQRDKYEENLATGGQHAQSIQKTIASLQEQLDELIKAKEEHENQLLSKFTLLLNEKRLKIRNQQRILQTANINVKKLEALQLTIKGEQTDRPVKKRSREETSNLDDDESDGFEAMDVDNSEANQDDIGNDSGDGGRATDTASEDDEDLDDVRRPIPPVMQKPPPPTTKKISPPPPPRALPFQKKNTEPQKMGQPSAKPDDDEGTASEDDEL